MSKDFFEHKAGSYDQNTNRVNNVSNIADAILNNVKFEKSMHLMDFGSGTGLLLERVAPFVKKITAVDISAAMNKQLEEKRTELECELEIQAVDLEKVDLEMTVDGVISSMTMHHVQSIEALFQKLFGMVKPGGFVALSDLDLEDGSFHTEDTGVYHFGFDRAAIATIAKNSGFKEVEVVDASIVVKNEKEYPVFLLKAIR